MTQLPNDTKYVVKRVIQDMVEKNLLAEIDRVTEGTQLDLFGIEVHNVDRLVFNIRLRPNGGGAPRYITVKVSEGW